MMESKEDQTMEVERAGLSRAVSASSSAPPCQLCEQLRRKGRFLRKCIHKDSSAPAPAPAARKASREDEIKESSTPSALKKVNSLSELFPGIKASLPSTFYSDLNKERPIKYEFLSLGKGLVRIVVAALDRAGAVLVITGLCASFNLDIRSGAILRRKSLGVILAYIEAKFDESDPLQVFDSTKQEAFITELNTLYDILATSRDKAVQQLLLRTVHAPSKLKSEVKIRPVKISITEEDSKFRGDADFGFKAKSEPGVGPVSCSVSAEDTIGFLFFLSTALTLRELDIDGIVIKSSADRVDDKLFLTPSRMFGGDSPDSSRKRLQEEIQTGVGILQNFAQALTMAPDPSQALKSFDQLLTNLERNSLASDFHQFMHEQTLKRLALILGSSTFLWESFLKGSFLESADVVKDDLKKMEDEIPSREEFIARINEKVTSSFPTDSSGQLVYSAEELRSVISRFKSHELFRIYIKNLLVPNISSFSKNLNDLAEALLESSLFFTERHAASWIGSPWPCNSKGEPFRFAIFGLGKFGGLEMGFASDLDLICVFDSMEAPDTSEDYAASAFFSQYVRLFLRVFSDPASKLGDAFDIDLRLRPYGSKALEATSLNKYREYYSETGNAQQFERQAMIRLRFVAGDPSLGSLVHSVRDQFVFSGASLNIEEATALRKRQVDELCLPKTINVKYGKGGLIDIEYAVQYLQMAYGDKLPCVRHPNVISALDALHASGVLPESLHASARDANLVLRHVIDALRMLRGKSKDLTLPALDPGDPDLLSLAKRLGYWEGGVAGLIAKVEAALSAAASLYEWTVNKLKPT